MAKPDVARRVAEEEVSLKYSNWWGEWEVNAVDDSRLFDEKSDAERFFKRQKSKLARIIRKAIKRYEAEKAKGVKRED